MEPHEGNAVTLNVIPAAVGIFEYGQNQAGVQNSNYSVNSASNPSHPGDFVVADLTGGGPVNLAGPLETGVHPPVAFPLQR